MSNITITFDTKSSVIMGTVCKAFAKPTLFVNESANAECCSYIRYDSNFIYHNIPMVGRLSLSQSLPALKYSMQIAFVSHFIHSKTVFADSPNFSFCTAPLIDLNHQPATTFVNFSSVYFTQSHFTSMKMIPNIGDKGRKKLDKTYSSIEKLKKELLTTCSSRLGNGQFFTILRDSSPLNK